MKRKNSDMKAKKTNPPPSSNKSDVYNVANCFRFDEEDSPKSPRKILHSTAMAQPRTIEFRPDKPYRLALYVQPSILKRRMDPTSSTMLANLSKMKRSKNKENITSFTEPPKTKQKVNIALFDEESEVSKNEKSTNQKSILKKDSTLKENTSKLVQKNILSYASVNEPAKKKKTEPEAADVSSLPKTKQKKMRRSYEKKFKEYMDSEKVVEPPSEEILKEMDIKKIATRTKQKKTSKEEKEFEQWAESMNSAFDDIDKFELSINYG